MKEPKKIGTKTRNEHVPKKSEAKRKQKRILKLKEEIQIEQQIRFTSPPLYNKNRANGNQTNKIHTIKMKLNKYESDKE